MGGPILVSLVVALALVPSTTAYELPSKLNEVAHVYSLGAGEVRCPSRAEWDRDWASSFGWAYTNVRKDYTVLGPVVCEGALGVGTADVPGWQCVPAVGSANHDGMTSLHGISAQPVGTCLGRQLVRLRRDRSSTPAIERSS